MFCKIVAPSSDIHKLPEVPKTFDELQRVALKRFSHEIPEKFSIKYKDLDEDLITVANDDDLQTAIFTHQTANVKTLRIFIVPQTDASSTQGGKTGPRPPSPIADASEKANNLPKIEIRTEESLIGQLDYISSDPGKESEENADLRTIYEQLPLMVDFRRTVSHNPQTELDRNKLIRKGFGTRDFIESPLPMIASPKKVNEEVLLNEHFDETQMKVIMRAVENKVKEQIDEKIKVFSERIFNKFQQEALNMGYPVGNNFGSRGTSYGFGPRMNMRIGRESHNEIHGSKYCGVCGMGITGIIYNCLVCKSFVCCEKCENNIDHEHPLLKIRISKEADGHGNSHNGNMGNRNDHGISSETFTLLNMLKRTSSYIENNSQSMISSGKQKAFGKNMNGMEASIEAIPSLSRSSTSQYVGKSGKGQDSFYNFASQNDDRNHQPLRSSTFQHESSNLGSPGVLSSCKLLFYKVALTKPPAYEVTTVKAGYPYNISFTIKNNGEIKWPENTRLMCVEGAHKGSDVELPSLGPGACYVVELHLEAPWELGRFFNEWKVQYTKDGQVKSFGKEISIEIEVIDGEKAEREKAKKEKHERAEKAHRLDKERESKGYGHSHHGERSKVGAEDNKLLEEFGCSEETLKNARILQDLMCAGSLREKVEFINNCSKEWDLNQIVSAYLSSPSKLKDMMVGHSTPQ